MIRVAVAGAAGRMGRAVCDAVEAADDMRVTGRADPSLGITLGDVLENADVVVDFTVPDQVIDNARSTLEAGVDLVVGATGFDDDELRRLCAHHPQRRVFVAPNFAIGAVLMMRFAAEAARHMDGAEIIEYHHPAKLDAPSGTARRTARMMGEAAERDVPIHSVRLPGVVADQDVILGGQAQTLTLRHVTTDRTSFMPGVLLAVRRVSELTESPTVGLERLLWP
jgi:4-hydroxy-tetrahydrodipicolinate reductase